MSLGFRPRDLSFIVVGGLEAEADALVWADLGGRPVLARTIESLHRLGAHPVVCLPRPLRAKVHLLPPPFEVAEAAKTRVGSLAAALPRLGTSWVVIVDAAQPFISPSAIERGLEVADANGVAVGVEPVTDTIKHVRGRTIEATIPRTDLRVLGSPRVYQTARLADAIAAAPDQRDEVACLLARGERVATIPVAASEGRIVDDLGLARARATLRAGAPAVTP